MARITDYILTVDPEPHRQRTRTILSAHPEVRKLFGPAPATAFYAVAIVLFQIIFAIYLKNSPVWVLLISAYLIGAFANHALYVIIHECTHNLVFKKNSTNRLLAIFANLPQFFPGAMPFMKYHLLHHRYQGELEWDADLPGPTEARFIGNKPLRKALFLLFFTYIEGVVRPARLKSVQLIDRWFLFNVFVQLGFLVLLFFFSGWKPLLYLALSTLFGIGLHPLGARWIQEHYVVKDKQETYSYYGLLNKFCFNVGYHNEHHDFMRVPWSRLPKIRAWAPEYYDCLYSHKSWSALLWKFIFDPQFSLYNRVVRPSHLSSQEEILLHKEPFEEPLKTASL